MADERDRRRNPNRNRSSSDDRVIYLDRDRMLGRQERERRTTTNSPRRHPVNMQRSGTDGRQRSGSSGQTYGEVRRTRRAPQGQHHSRRTARANAQRPAPPARHVKRVKVKRRPPSRGIMGTSIGLLRSVVTLQSDVRAEGTVRPGRHNTRQANNKGILIVVGVFFLLILVYLGGYALNMPKEGSQITYETVMLGSVDSAKSAEGVIIRSEKVFTAPAAGAIEYGVAEDERIKSGTVVCSISDAAAVAELQQQLEATNEDILKLQENRTDISEHTEEVNKINSRIRTLSDETAFDFVKGDISGLYTLKQNVKKQVDSRNQLLLTENSGALSTLVGQRNNELNRINDSITTVASDVGGIVSYNVDGLEGELTPDKVATLTKEQVEESKGAVSETRTNAAAGDILFKVITSNTWYIASYMPESYTEGWEVGREMELYVGGSSGRDTLPVSVSSITPVDKESYVVFVTDKYISDYMTLRNITFETEKPKVGYKIPNTAISQQTLLKVPVEYVDIDDSTLLKVVNDKVTQTEITISGYDETGAYALIPIQMGLINVGDTLRKQEGEDTFIISDVVTEDGVFIVNAGVTAFTKVELTNSVTNGSYTVLDESLNTGINIYDRIVQDVANVQANQNIYE